MHVASLSLCKELYELSEWDDTEFVYYSAGGPYKNAVVQRKGSDLYTNSIPPAYDLGYLLRKLPPEPAVELKSGNWLAIYRTNPGFVSTIADTPEDAAAKLAIELFKQSILIRE